MSTKVFLATEKLKIREKIKVNAIFSKRAVPSCFGKKAMQVLISDDQLRTSDCKHGMKIGRKY